MPVSRSLVSRQRIYKKRGKKSKCKKMPRGPCNKKTTCKYVSTQKRKYCRKRRNLSTRRRSSK